MLDGCGLDVEIPELRIIDQLAIRAHAFLRNVIHQCDVARRGLVLALRILLYGCEQHGTDQLFRMPVRKAGQGIAE